MVVVVPIVVHNCGVVGAANGFFDVDNSIVFATSANPIVNINTANFFFGRVVEALFERCNCNCSTLNF